MPRSSHELQTIVIGAGPAGLTAAIAASVGSEVTVYEQLTRPGAKLLATGGGKCNLTNVLSPLEFALHFGRQGRFILPALNLLPPPQLCRFFAERGITTIAEDGFHIFPASHKASDILRVLLAECKKCKVRIITSAPIDTLWLENGMVAGAVIDGKRIKANRIIIAAGGKGYPELGGNCLGYRLAVQAGHEIKTPLPALVGLKTTETWPAQCAGISFPNAKVTIALPKFGKQGVAGELLFTHHGISGPPVIDLSGDVSLLLQKHDSVPMTINLCADKTRQCWMAQYLEWQRDTGKKHLRNLLAAYMPHVIADIICAQAENIGDIKAATFSAEGREKLTCLLTALPLHASGTEGWAKAMVTRGGVSLKNVNPETLESRIVEGLFFAGEVLDLDGPCGGYNLQWAFSSGFLAGTAAVK